MATPSNTDRLKLLQGPVTTFAEAIAFFEEMRKLMSGIGDIYKDGSADIPRTWVLYEKKTPTSPPASPGNQGAGGANS